MLNPRRVLSKDQIMDRVWDYDFGGHANVVETYVSYLRRKIDTATCRPWSRPCAASATPSACRVSRRSIR